MSNYGELSNDELKALLKALQDEYTTYQAKGLKLNMARGKPASAQLDLSTPLLDILNASEECIAADGTDCRNYGVMDGIPEAKELMASMLNDDPENVIVLGNSSLTAMYDTVARLWMFGTLGSDPWCQLPQVKWLCPSPGYDRHFGVTGAFGMEMIPVRMNDDGPDMDEIERFVAEDASVKGIWCVPQYSNPGGITYSDEVVQRLANMECAAEDFRIIWDNAYCVHHLHDDEALQDRVMDIADACVEAGNPDRYLKFASTSKITLPGAGIAAMAASPENIAEAKKHLNWQIISHDKLNQLRHVRFLGNAEGISKHMSKHAAIIRPKFELVLRKLAAGLNGTGVGKWTNPRGGYFISFDAMEGTAKRVVQLAKEAGVAMTGAGATWPYGNDPYDSNIRIAPTLPPLEELDAAMDVFVCCAKLAAVEKLLGE